MYGKIKIEKDTQERLIAHVFDTRDRKCFRKCALCQGDRNVNNCGVIYSDLEENQFNPITAEK